MTRAQESLFPDEAAKEPARDSLFAEVAVPVHLATTYTYRLPAALTAQALPGARVLVPFGRQKVTGYIVKVSEDLDPSIGLGADELKEIEELLDTDPPVTHEVLELTRWVSEYYAAPWGEVLRAALPSGMTASSERTVAITEKGRAALATGKNLRPKSAKARALALLAASGELTVRELGRDVGADRASRVAQDLVSDGLAVIEFRPSQQRVQPKRRKVVRLLTPAAACEEQDGKTTDAQQRVIDLLAESGGAMAFADLLRIANTSASVIQTLVRRGRAEVVVESIRRDPLAGAALQRAGHFELTSAQSEALTAITAAISGGEYATFLLHGVTGSGKTEIYIRAMRAALEQGRSSLMLVPEIALTPVFSRRLRAHFGDLVAIFHSSLSQGERFDEWTRLRRGEARIVIGTRSAVFTPVEDLGLVVVDEEHETSYRQQESPIYNGRDAAIVRARNRGAVVVLGSATPSLESFHNAKTGKYAYLRLAERIGGRSLASAEIVDMREVFARSQKPVMFSERMLEAIRETHARGEQVIILINRRGFSSVVLCRSCGESVHCTNCDVTMTYHRGRQSLLCHYCNFQTAAPKVCPVCASKYLFYIGEGAEKVEDAAHHLFPEIRIARLDRDTASRKNFYEQVLLEFDQGRVDMLVGTQMLAKGHDFPNVTLVGVVSVDAGLSLPDFRSAERTFQLITQVAGRAGRGDRPGHVIIQSYHPAHYALRFAAAQDYEGFYNEEINFRRQLAYPPFVALASFLVHNPDFKEAMGIAAELRGALDDLNTSRTCRILGPAPAPFSRLRGEHRVLLLLKSSSRKEMRSVIDAAMERVKELGCDMRSVVLEIDPVALL